MLFYFPNRDALTLAGTGIVFIVMLKAKKCEILDAAIRPVMVKMSHLTTLDTKVVPKTRAETAPAPAHQKYMRLGLRWEFGSIH